MSANIPYIKNKFVLAVLVLVGLLLSQVMPASAARMYTSATSQKLNIGDTVIVSVFIDTEEQNINVVEGQLQIVNAQNIVIKDFSLANSALTMWPRKPSWSSADREISFIGGVPGGLKEKNALLFKVVLLAQAAGQIELRPIGIRAYANDGAATELTVNTLNLSMEISDQKTDIVKNEWEDIISQDNIRPYNLIFEIGQDASLFDGQKFLTFSASDDESGIAYYEIKEGDRITIRSGSPYVLQNQDQAEPIIITAYDKAGNSSQLLVKPYAPLTIWNYLALGLIILVVIGLLWLGYKIIAKKFLEKQKKK